MKKIEEGMFDRLKGIFAPKSIEQPNINKDLMIAAGQEEIRLQKRAARDQSEKDKKKAEFDKHSDERDQRILDSHVREIANLTKNGDTEEAMRVYKNLTTKQKQNIQASEYYSSMLKNYYKIAGLIVQSKMNGPSYTFGTPIKESQNKKEPNKMTLTKDVLTRIIKEELAKIVNEQRNPRQINEIGSGDPVLDANTIAMIIKSLGSTAAVTNFMAALNAAVGVGGVAAAAASKYKTSKQTFDGGEEEAMQEAKKKAASTGSAAKMGLGTKSKIASQKFSPLRAKK